MPMNRLLRLPLTIFERSYAGGRYIERLHFDFCDLVADRQRRACGLVCEQHAFTAACVESLDSAPSVARRQIYIYTFDGWTWI